MQRASYFVTAMLLTFLLGAWTPSAVSLGGVKPCDHKGIGRVDLDKVRAPATRTAAPHHLDWRSVYGCTHSRGAWLDVDIFDEPQPDGSVIVGAAWCSRAKVGNWECEYGSGRGYHMTVMIAGKPRTLAANIPENISVEAVTRMMQHAIDIAPTLTMAQSCDYMPTDGQGDDSQAKATLEEIQRDFRFTDDQPYAHIVDWGGHWSIGVGANELDYSAADDAAGFRFSCWGITISVT